MDREEIKEYLNEEKEKVNLLKKPKILKKLFKLYKNLCPECRNKATINPRMNIKEYCPKCQDKCRKLYEEVIKEI